MPEIFKRGNLIIDRETRDWREAVGVCGALLEKSGAAAAQYTDAMVRAVEELGPYIVIVPHMAVAHAAAGEHVLRDEFVMAVFKNPVFFGCENDPVHIIIGLCATSQDSHLKQFRHFADILEDGDIYSGIMACDREGQLYDYLRSL